MAKSNPPTKKKYIESPEKLWELFTQFVEHEKSNPFLKVEYVGKDGNEVNTALQVPIMFESFECWLADNDIISGLSHYSQNLDGRYESYVQIITRIKQNCFSQNFKGAAVGLFNANLIARKLGLNESVNQTITTSVQVLNVDPLDSSNDKPMD